MVEQWMNIDAVHLSFMDAHKLTVIGVRVCRQHAATMVDIAKC